ncbi:hypothetical protein BSIN_5024 [Burkholderia singularis]|uniref:Uncharacterized protein n=1 Tax=Burkholderia singularis TaxID=1503053 RepID=A0A238HAI9_9BURK|nr:hypothetical protein BSIN_5024 [Burkholderia singularis]
MRQRLGLRGIGSFCHESVKKAMRRRHTGCGPPIVRFGLL